MLKTLLLFVRFNIVGILATVSYFASGMGLGASTDMSPLTIHLLAFFVSIVVSYLGHAYFTFKRSGPRYLLRFAVITGVLFAASTALTVVMADMFHLSELWTVTVVTIAYPVFSFLLHTLWTFKDPGQ